MFPSIVARATNGAALCPCNVVGHPSTFFFAPFDDDIEPDFFFLSLSLSRSTSLARLQRLTNNVLRSNY